MIFEAENDFGLQPRVKYTLHLGHFLRIFKLSVLQIENGIEKGSLQEVLVPHHSILACLAQILS